MVNNDHGCSLQELVDSGLVHQLPARTSELVSVLMQLLSPPREIDGAVLKQKCIQINKSLDVLNDILVMHFLEHYSRFAFGKNFKLPI